MVCVSELKHLFGVKDQPLQDRFFVVVVLVNLLCNLVLSKAQMSVSWQSLLPAYPDAVDVLIEKFIVL